MALGTDFHTCPNIGDMFTIQNSTNIQNNRLRLFWGLRVSPCERTFLEILIFKSVVSTQFEKYVFFRRAHLPIFSFHEKQCVFAYAKWVQGVPAAFPL